MQRAIDEMAADQAEVQIRLLGGFSLTAAGRMVPGSAWRLQKAQGLVKLLALAPGYRLPRDQVIDLLWPDLEPEAAVNNLHQALHVARRALQSVAGEDLLALRLQRQVLSLDGRVIRTDVQTFETAAAAARESRDLADYRMALALYAGELLPDDRYEDWAAWRRESLQQLFQTLSFEAAEEHERRGDLVEATELMERLLALDPANEEAHVTLMRVHARAGRRQQALRQYARLQEALHRELDAEPDIASRRMYAEIMATEPTTAPPSAAEAARPLGNMPAELDHFIGRERELGEVWRLLRQTRLLTLTGAGGSGKTRLALAAAQRGEPFPGGAWLVELAGLSEPERVVRAIAEALDVHEDVGTALLPSLRERLTAEQALLVLDNCEHLVEACALVVSALLKSCPVLRILATSREPLNVAGEMVWQVPALAPAEAIRLFADRAQFRLPSFVVGEANRESVREICARLDGLPLAIELAAARVGVLAPDQIAERLDDALPLLAAGSRTALPRQRTVRATLDWSFALLSGEERVLLRRLAVFRGSWLLPAAEALYGDGDALLPLAQLVDRSLVQVEDGRYRLLEVVRQYAHDKLEEAGEVAVTRKRHATYYLAFSAGIDSGLNGPQQAAWLERLERTHDNLRAALGWYRDHDPVAGLELAANLWRFWYAHKHLREGQEWLTGLLAAASDAPLDVRARATRGVATLTYGRRDLDTAMTLMEEALSLQREVGDRHAVAITMRALGVVACDRGECERAAEHLEESLGILRELGDVDQTGTVLANLAIVAYRQGDLDRARELLEQGLAIHRRLGDTTSVAIALNNLAEIADVQGDTERAGVLYREVLTLGQELGDLEFVQSAIDGLARCAYAAGNVEHAARLQGAASRVRQTIGVPLPVDDQRRLDQILAQERAAMGERAFRATWDAGEALELDEVVAIALANGSLRIR